MRKETGRADSCRRGDHKDDILGQRPEPLRGQCLFTAAVRSLPTSTSIDPTTWNTVKVLKMLLIRLRAVVTRLVASEQSQGHGLPSNFY